MRNERQVKLPVILVFMDQGLVDKMRSAKKPTFKRLRFLVRLAAATPFAAVTCCALTAWTAFATEPVNKFRTGPTSEPSGVAASPLRPGTGEALPRLPGPATTEPRQTTETPRIAKATPRPKPSIRLSEADFRGAVILSSRNFGIPFNVDKTGSRPAEVRLFVSQGSNSSWELSDRKPPTVREFQFQGTRDGLFWFATRTVDHAGNAYPAAALAPQLKVIVDTTKPDLKLSAESDPIGKINAVVKYTDITPIKSVQIHYATDVLRKWTSLSPKNVTAEGKLTFTPKENWQQLSLQVIVMDSAGNKSIVSKLVQRPRIAIGIPRKFAANDAAKFDNAVYESETDSNAKPSVELVAGPTGNVFVHQSGSTPGVTSTVAPKPASDSAQPAHRIAQTPAPLSGPPLYRAPMPQSPVTSGNLVPNNYFPNQPPESPRSAAPNSLGLPTGPATSSVGSGANTAIRDFQNYRAKQLNQGTFGPPSIHQKAAPRDVSQTQTAPIAQNSAVPNVNAGEFNLPGQPAAPKATGPILAGPTQTQTAPTGQPQFGTFAPPSVGNGTEANALSGISPPGGISPPSMGMPTQATPETSARHQPQGGMTLPVLPPVSQATPTPITKPQPSSRAASQAVTNATPTSAPNRSARTPQEAMRPIEQSRPTKLAQPKPPAYPETPDSQYRAQRQSQADYDRAMLAGRAPIRYSDSEKFSLEYELEAVGAGGTSAVELYGSTDGGKSWKRWGIDPDSESPFDIETKGEGAFSFRIVVISHNGLASPRPLAGDTPDIVVVVDKTSPKVKFTEVRYGAGERTGSMVIRYSSEEAHFMQRPIALSFSDSIQGPWTTIAAGLRDVGEYVWPGDPELPRQIFLRIDAKDRAGNIGTYILDKPIDARGLAPRARIRGFQSLSGTDSVPNEPNGQTATVPSASFK